MHQNNNSNMIKVMVYIGFVVYVMAFTTTCCCNPVTSSEVESIARPTRPKTFGSPDELRSYLDQLGQYLAVVSRPRFGKRKPTFPIIPSAITTPRLQQYIDHQHMLNNILNREDDETYKLQYKPATIRNSKDLYDMLFTTRHENGNNDRHQYYLMQQDLTNADIGLDSN
ncbi:Neuropeptide F, partial [Aphis craccivora]